METREGGCRCGAIRFQVVGEPLRIGLCHCTDCRKTGGSAFNMFAVWPRSAFSCTGEFAIYEGTSFCSNCGSRVFSITPDEAEILAGALDNAPTALGPTYELWVPRREEWLHGLPWADQHTGDRADEAGDWRVPLQAG